MTNRRFSAGTFAAWILPFLLAAALLLGAPTVGPRTALAQSAEQCADQLIFDPNKGAFLTSDILFLPTQEGANCYAWQMFVAMNWPVNPGWPATPALAGEPDRTASVAEWGVPSSPTSPITSVPVWGSFKAAEDIFLPNAAQPTGWGVQEPPPSECRSDKMIFGYPPESVRVLSAISKNAVNSAHRFNLSSGTRDTVSQEIMEATGGWLTDQDGKLVFFQRTVGKAEFDYIVDNNLFDAADQLRVATNQDGQHPKGLSLPRGGMLRTPPSHPQPQEKLGAFEIKAAWRILTGEPEMFSRYMTTVAWLKRPDTGQCSQEVVGLVGLHIIHKTDTFPDFIWATFEQVDNVPGGSGSPPVNGYSFNNPDCTGPDCTPNQPRIECDGNTCRDLYPRDQPVQVDRSQKTPNDMVELNSSVQQKIASLTGGKSVFQYYELVNVLWDQSPSSEPTLEPGAGATVPLRYGTFQSEGNLPVANTTLETYIQSRSCDACHASATIAGSDTLASDFSFLFEDADSSKAPHLVEQVKRFAEQSK